MVRHVTWMRRGFCAMPALASAILQLLRRDWLSHSLQIFFLSLADTGSRALAESPDLGAAAEGAKADAAFEDSDPSTNLRKVAKTAEKVHPAPERSTKGARHEDGSEQQRRLDVAVSGSTIEAPSPSGNPTCGFCDNGCESKTYTVVGSGGPMVASTCGYVGFDTRIIVYEGSSCAALTCIGERRRGE
jgi:hypothetical protein